MRMSNRNNLRVVAMDHRVQRHRIVYIRINRGIMLHNLAVKVEGDDVNRSERSERWPKTIHEHLVLANGYTEVSGHPDAQPCAIQNARGTTNIPLNAFNRC